MTVPVIFSAARRDARQHRQRGDAFLLEQLALRVHDRLAALTHPPRHVAVLGIMPDSFRDDLRALYPDATISAATLTDEILHVDGTPDVIVDLGQLALVNDLPGLLIQIRRLLPPDGLFIGAIYGGESLSALRAALLQAESNLTGGGAPRLHPMLALEDATALLQRAGFALPVADKEVLRVTYRSLQSLARDLRAAGLSNALAAAPRTVPPRALFAAAEEIWRANSALEDGKLMAGFDIISLTGWAPAV